MRIRCKSDAMIPIGKYFENILFFENYRLAVKMRILLPDFLLFFCKSHVYAVFVFVVNKQM
jgi:hypothetical protein